MKLIICCCILAALATACVDQPTVHLLPDDRLIAIEIDEAPAAQPASDPSICEVLPDDGPCADACDHDALVEDVPQGTCVDFRCELTDGRVVRVGACHH